MKCHDGGQKYQEQVSQKMTNKGPNTERITKSHPRNSMDLAKFAEVSLK